MPVAAVDGLPAVARFPPCRGFVFTAAFPIALFDVMFRVIENTSAPKSVLQSDCTAVPLL